MTRPLGRCWAPVRGEVRACVVVGSRGAYATVAIADPDRAAGFTLVRVAVTSLERRVCRYDLDTIVPR